MSARCRRPSGNFLKALQLDKDAVWQHLQALAPDSDERKIIRLGVESELLCTDEDSRPVPIVKTLVSKLGKPYFMTELNAASFEIVTDPLPSAPNVFRRMWEQYSMRVREFVAFAHGRVLEGRRVDRCIGGGLQSVVDPGRWPADQILTDGVRYRQATAYLAKRHDNFTFMLPTLDGTSFAIDNPYSPLAASLTLGFSPNIQFPIDQIGLAANLAAATAFIAPVIASCSPFAAGRIGSWCSRIPMWAYGIDPDAELTTFAPGGYFSAPGRESVMEWIDFIMKGEQVLEQEEVGESKATGEFPAINLMIGTRWVQVGRIRFALQEGAFNVWFESRPWDAQLFPWDNFVNLIFFAGLLAGLLREVASAEELIPYEDAKNAFLECVQLGHCELPWRAQKRSAREVIKNELVETARRGLVAEGLYDELAEQALEAISSRCDGRTGAHFMLDWMKAWAGAFPTWEHALGKLSFEVGGAHLWPKLFNGVHHYVGAPR